MKKKRSNANAAALAAEQAVGVPADRVRALEMENRRLRREVRTLSGLEKTLQASERKYRDLVDNAIDGICVLQDEMLTYANPRLCEMLECSAERLIGTPFTSHLAPEERERAAALYRRMTSHEAFPQHYETILVGSSGARIDVGVSATPAELDGTPSVVIVLHDITAHRNALRMAIENERLEAVRTMARGVGNNFANILSVINSYAVSIADSFLPNTPPHVSAVKILDAVRHAGDLTKRLLGVVRVSGSFADARVQPVEVGAIVRNACDLIAPTLREKRIAPDIAAAAEIYGMADAGQLLDALMNILLNGVDAMPRGGTLTIRLSDKAELRDAAGVSAGAGVEVSVTDTGTGMSDVQMSRAFEPFFTTKEDRDAFGLGLSVAQSMVKSWGGRIDLSSEPGVGTCVRILMPRAEAPPRAPDVGGEDRRRTILVAEDDGERRRMMTQALKQAGHTVIEAADGMQAISAFRDRADEIDLTVLDWIMPGVDGRDVLQFIQAHDPESRVLMTSGFSRDYVRSQIRMGAWTFLQKPFTVEQFDEAVRKALVVAKDK